eukprot:TRINITY_DN2710_c0_g2_i3.p1 TRINITY_DN2710_c0_g2~~TRINITY_DN2710_c0_g2_i3.p1  ORF type:complete len:271 (-),score=40.25 TRINITY_DN2710_c0_g2_i3:493-1230(-)
MASTHTTLAEVKQGAFVRIDSSFRNFISEGGKFPPEPNRYHLYISYACPWASRCLALYYMKGLEDIIGLSIVHPTWGRTKPEKDEHCGWLFKDPNDPPVSNPLGHGSFDCSACIPDTVNGFKTVRELYEKSEDTLGKYSVPVLWDKKFQTIVNNESAEIMLMFNTEFNQWAKNPSLDLCPKDLEQEIESYNSWIYPNINNGVYRCGFATAQEPYERAFQELFDSLDRLEGILSERYNGGYLFEVT